VPADRLCRLRHRSMVGRRSSRFRRTLTRLEPRPTGQSVGSGSPASPSSPGSAGESGWPIGTAWSVGIGPPARQPGWPAFAFGLGRPGSLVRHGLSDRRRPAGCTGESGQGGSGSAAAWPTPARAINLGSCGSAWPVSTLARVVNPGSCGQPLPLRSTCGAVWSQGLALGRVTHRRRNRQPGCQPRRLPAHRGCQPTVVAEPAVVEGREE